MPGIQLGHSIVVPENGVSAAGEEEWNGNLRIELDQLAREPGDIEVAILKLPGAIEMLSGLERVLYLRGFEGRLGRMEVS